MTVDSQVTLDDGAVTKGVTDYSVNLNQAENVDDSTSGINLGTIFLRNIFGIKVSATTYDTSYTSKWDKNGGIKIHETVYWTITGSHNDNKLNITEVTGGYTISDSSYIVKSSSVEVQQVYHPSQDYAWSEDTKSSWLFYTGYSAVPNTPGSRGEVGYTVNIKRGGSSWSVTLNNTVFSY